MSKIMELRTKRNTLWEQTKASWRSSTECTLEVTEDSVGAIERVVITGEEIVVEKAV